MKTRLRIIITSLLLLLITFSLTSCEFLTIERNKYDASSGYFLSDSLNYNITKKDYENIDKYKALVDNSLANNQNVEEFSSNWTTVIYYFNYITKCYVKSKIACDMEITEEGLNKSNELLKYYLSFYNWYKNSIVKIANSNFKEYVFNGMSEEEINEYIANISSSSGENNLEYQTSLASLQNEFSLLEKSEYNTKGYQIYSKIITLNNDYAKTLKFDNYIEYINDHYDRDYGIKDINNFISYVKKYLMPLYKNYYELFNSKMNDITKLNEINDFKKIINSNFMKYKDYIDGYSNYLGNGYLDIYKDFYNKGHYFLSNKSTAYDGAYTSSFYDGSYYMYFGPNYQNLFTFIHEYGHYTSFMLGTTSSLDINEIQSQANELLLLNYLVNNYSGYSIDLLKVYKIYESLSTIMRATIVYDFEMNVYQNNYQDKYDELYDEILKEYGDYEFLAIKNRLDDYWYIPTINSPGYYISYAVSLTSAFTIYSDSNNSDKGKEEYLKLIVTNSNGINELCEEINLANPFVEQTFINLKEIISI